MVVYLRWTLLTGRTDAAAHDRSVAGLVRYLAAERPDRPHLGMFLDAWRATSNARPAFARMQAARGGDELVVKNRARLWDERTSGPGICWDLC